MPRPRRLESPTVKTTVDLPQEIWRAAKIQAVNEQTDLRSVIIAALGAYLKVNEVPSQNAK